MNRDRLSDLPNIESIEILELLGQGGMSLVYKARQKALNRIVAVKVLSSISAEDALKRFQREAKLNSVLEHPNIVRIIAFGISLERKPYLVMEYLDGFSLAQQLKEQGRLSLQQFKELSIAALSALNHAHQSGIVHRDIKPGNIMICRDEEGKETVKLVDFGIAKLYVDIGDESQKLTATSAVIGSPTYMSPEQCQGKPLDGRSDLYSLACVMYESLCGEPPFSANSQLELMHKHSVMQAPSPAEFSTRSNISKELAGVILWGLAKDPALRPQSADEFASRLKIELEKPALAKLSKPKSIKAFALILAASSFLVLGYLSFINAPKPQHIQDGDTSKITQECRESFRKGVELAKKQKTTEAIDKLRKALELADPKQGFFRLSEENYLEDIHFLAEGLVNRRTSAPDAPYDTRTIAQLVSGLQFIGSYAKKSYHSDYSDTLRALGYLERIDKHYVEALQFDSQLLEYERGVNRKLDVPRVLTALQSKCFDFVYLHRSAEAKRALQEMESIVGELEEGNPNLLIGKYLIAQACLELYHLSNDKAYKNKRIALLQFLAKNSSEHEKANSDCIAAREELKRLSLSK